MDSFNDRNGHVCGSCVESWMQLVHRIYSNFMGFNKMWILYQEPSNFLLPGTSSLPSGQFTPICSIHLKVQQCTLRLQSNKMQGF